MRAMRWAVSVVGLVFGVVAWATAFAPAARAQTEPAAEAWLQIEAQPSLALAQERARAYAALFPDTNGFQVGSGWYAVVLGPYPAARAAAELDALRRENLIPGDSFVSDGKSHRQRFWPVGAVAAPEPEPAPEPTAEAAPEPTAEGAAPAPRAPEAESAAAPPPAPPPAPPLAAALPDESLDEARASEAALDQAGREALQEALQWYGLYSGEIDGAFGPGTRTSMAAWQSANGHEPTGVLTQAERAALAARHSADIAEFGFAPVAEAEAGIEITLPMALVAFDHYEPPFVHFAAQNGSGLRIILISQPGDEESLAGLYDVLQTLAIIPPEGPRARTGRSFTIDARSDTVESHAFAAADKGQVKGYIAVWNPADRARMERILPVLAASFRAVGDTALDPGLVPLDAATRAGLLAGLEIRHPAFTQSGFYIDPAGRVLTFAPALAGCGRLTIEGGTEVSATFSDAASGLAVLSPSAPLSPRAVAEFQAGAPESGAGIVVAGYSWGEKLPAPVLTAGVFEEGQGLQGEPDLSRLTAPVLAGDVGGPVLDATGAVIGMLLPTPSDGARTLPAGVSYAARAGAITARLATAGIATRTAPRTTPATPDALNAEGLGMTVLVSCWR